MAASETVVCVKDAALALFGGRCVWCGCPLTVGELTLDHLMPKGQGGPDRFPNLAPAHERCNFRRSHIDPADWAFVCALRGRQANFPALRQALLLLAEEPGQVGAYARWQLRRFTADAHLRPIRWPRAGSATGGHTDIYRAIARAVPSGWWPCEGRRDG